MRKLLSSPRTAYPAVFLIALSARLATMLAIREPGYMDAFYYYDVASNLFRGKGFTEDFIWNYLAIPSSVTHPSNLYWMPFVSVLMYLSFLLFGEGFRSAQVPLALLSSAYPVVAFWLGRDVFRNLRYAWAMALLTIFSGVAFVYWVVPDNFAPFALAGCLSLIFAYKGVRDSVWYFAAAGAAAGVCYLSRPDGLLLVITALLLVPALFFVRPIGAIKTAVEPIPGADGPDGAYRTSRRPAIRQAGLAVAGLLIAFIIVVSPWLVRDQLAFGTPWPSAGTKTLFLTEYNDIFAFEKDLTLGQYLNWGWDNILRSKGEATLSNLLTFGELHLFYMLPFALLGFYLLRSRVAYWPFFIYAVLLLLAMSLAFTFPGPRGSYLHSASSLLPFLFGAAVLGMDTTIAAVGRKLKHWRVPLAQRNFTIVFVVFAIVASVGFAVRASASWDEYLEVYEALGAWLSPRLAADELVMNVDPPGYYYATGRKSIGAINNDLDTAVAVCRRYGARYILMGAAHPQAWHRFYLGKEDALGLSLVGEVKGVRIYEVRKDVE